MNWRLALKIAAAAIIIAALVIVQTQTDRFEARDVRSAFADFGWWAAPAFIAFYAIATLLHLPAALFTIAAGVIFGFWTGFLLVACGAVIGAVLAFGVARRLGREWFHGMAAGRLARLDREVGKHGFATVFVARLIPLIPFTTSNYVFGLTAVTFRSYLIATSIGILPGTATYVAVGAFGFEPGSWPFIIAVTCLIALSLAGVVRSRLRARSGRTDATGTDATRGDAT